MDALVAVDDAAAVEIVSAAFVRGAVILHPTSTVFGLGGDPTNPNVVRRINHIKGRRADKPYLLLTDDWERLGDWVAPPAELVEALMTIGLSLPLTILFEAGPGAPSESVGPTGHIAIRRSGLEFCRSVIRRADQMLVSTSANAAGAPTPNRYEDIEAEILAKVDIVVKAPPCSGTASTLVGVTDGKLTILREGAVSKEELLAELQKL